MTALSIASSNGSGVNQRVFLRLKQALLLNLRRQILIAVCDNLQLRQTLITRLQRELTNRITPQQNFTTAIAKNPAKSSSSVVTNWVNLRLNVEEPNLITQIEQWFAENPETNASIGFQIIGVEQLTRQPAAIQWSFLHDLRTLESHFPQLEFSLLLWIPSPWLNCIQKSAPEFWRWRTGVFEFVGEPTPATSITQDSIQVLRPSQPRESQLSEVSRVTSEKVATADPYFASDPSQKSLKSPPPSSPGKTSLTVKKTPNLTQTLKQIQHLQQISVSPKQLTRAYRILSERLRQQIQKELTSSEQMQQAIVAYETGWQQLENATPPILNPSEIVDWLNDLGTLYWMRFHQEKSVNGVKVEVISDLEQSIIFYQKALMHTNPQKQRAAYARLQKNLGAAYADLATIREPVENLQQSIYAYGEAIRNWKVATGQQSELELQNPEQVDQAALSFAATQNNLGTVYWNLAQHTQPSYHLKAAISAYMQAGRYYNQSRYPLKYGMIQANLGTAYWNLAQHEPDNKWLHCAVKAYQNALKYRTPNTDGAACAATQNNLGIAYWHLANRYQDSEIRAKFLQKAIASYEVALTLVKPLSPTQLNFDPKATHNNLGLAHFQLATDYCLGVTQTERVTHLEAALHHHLQASSQQASQGETPTAESGRHQIALSYLIKTMRAIYQESGLPGQNRALSQIPAHLLSEILRSL